MSEQDDAVNAAEIAMIRQSTYQVGQDGSDLRMDEYTIERLMREPMPPRYRIVEDLVTEFRAAQADHWAAGERFDRANTTQAHEADDYGQPDTELNQARHALYQASHQLDRVHDNLVVTCATLADPSFDWRLGRLLEQRREHLERQHKLARRLMADFEYP